jgi:protein involved in polysaccharide export with SLBB domain
MKKNKVALLLSMLLCTTLAEAQGERGSLLSPMLTATSTTNYYFAKPNELTITVDIMGFIQRPGRYEVSNSVSLVNLLALAGGTTADGSLSDVRITRLADVDGNIVVKDLRLNLDEIHKLNPPDLVLQQGDVIQIHRTGWSTVRDVFSAVVSLAVVLSAVAQVVYFTK